MMNPLALGAHSLERFVPEFLTPSAFGHSP